MSRILIKSFLTDCDPYDLAFIPNATTGTNTVVRSCLKNMRAGDLIVTLNTAYGVLYVQPRVYKKGKRVSYYVFRHTNGQPLAGR